MATRNMKQWVAQQISQKEKQAFPILSFPCVRLLDVSVRDLISDSSLQANIDAFFEAAQSFYQT